MVQDPQIVTALRSIDHDVFPFSAFNTAGQLVKSPSVPDDLQRELAEVLRQPDWKRVFAAVSLFDNVGHHATNLGFKMDGKGISLVVVRPQQTIRDAASGAKWYGNLTMTILASIQENAGKAYYVKPSWIDAIRKILGLLKGQADQAAMPPRSDADLQVIAELTLAVEFILGILEIANSFGRNHNVSCAVVWEYPLWYGRLTQSTVRPWAPIGSVVNHNRMNVTGLIWDRLGRTMWEWSRERPWYGMRVSPATLLAAWYPSGVALADATGGDKEPTPGPQPALPIPRGPRRTETGIASWYDCPGRRAAHRTLPFGTKVTVTNVSNRKSVVVTIADRGPFIPGRVIDLCKDAFAAIASPSAGVARVRLRW